MGDKQYSFTSKQRRMLYLVAGLFWLLGIAILYYSNELSVYSFVAWSVFWIGLGSYNKEVKWWANLSWIAVGFFYIVMWYLDYINPSGAIDVKKWWILGIGIILMGIYWLVQKALVRLSEN